MLSRNFDKSLDIASEVRVLIGFANLLHKFLPFRLISQHPLHNLCHKAVIAPKIYKLFAKKGKKGCF